MAATTTSTRKPATRRSDPATNGNGSARGRETAVAEVTAEEFADAVADGVHAAVEAATDAGIIAPARDLPGAAEESDITDEVEKGGPALGSFVKSVGLAVAEAQAALDKTLVETTEALSKQNVKVVAVFEQLFDDDGNMEKGNPIVLEQPLAAYIFPTAYQWERVYLEADMNVAEFNAKNGLNIKASSFTIGTDVRASGSMFGFNASGGFDTRFSTSNVSTAASASTDTAAGRLHLEATLTPRADLQTPRPFVVQKGPQITLSAGTIEDIMSAPPANSSDPATVIGRKATIGVVSLKKDGSGNQKNLVVTVEPASLSISSSPANFAPNDQGELTLTVERKGSAFDPAKPIDAIVRVNLRLISQSIAIKL
jgi:hypothetical protein